MPGGAQVVPSGWAAKEGLVQIQPLVSVAEDAPCLELIQLQPFHHHNTLE